METTITNEVKAKVFAQYLGQQVHSEIKSTCKLSGVLINDHKEWCAWLTGKTMNSNDSIGLSYAIEDCKLILTPLSSISDEDAIEVSKMNTWFNRSKDDKYEVYENWQNKKVVSSGGGIKYEKCVIEYESLSLAAFQFLQSRGYDLPQWTLGGKTLHESGLCIYKTKEK